MIYIANLAGRQRIPVRKVKRLAREILKGEDAPDLSLSFAFVDNREIRKINGKFLGHDYETDVLAFALEDAESVGGVHGEVVISVEFANAEAKKRRIPREQEMLRYVTHGVLHLLGYEDATPAKKKKMWRKQESYLRSYASSPK